MNNHVPQKDSISRSPRNGLNLALFSVHGDPLAPLGSEGAGGQNVYVREVARALARRGHRVDVFTRSREGSTLETQHHDGYQVIRVPAGPQGFIPRTQLFHHLPEFVDRTVRFVRQSGRRYDVLHTNYWLSGWVGMRLHARWSIPHIHTNHSLGAVKFSVEGPAPAHGRVRIAVEEALIKQATRMVVNSPQEAQHIRHLYDNYGRLEIIPCGIDDRIFHSLDRSQCRRAFGLPVNVPILAYAGRFVPAKGIETLLQAFRLIREQRPVQLIMAGGFDPNGPDRTEYERIQAWVDQHGLGDSVSFLGKMRQEKLAMVYGAADLCLVPSHYESFGLVAIEAMGFGVPVIASRVGGLQFTIKDEETGLLVPPRHEQTMAAACERLLDDTAQRERMGLEAMRRVRRFFTWEAVAQELEGLYIDVASQRILAAGGA